MADRGAVSPETLGFACGPCGSAGSGEFFEEVSAIVDVTLRVTRRTFITWGVMVVVMLWL
jgi:hypothetical protein